MYVRNEGWIKQKVAEMRDEVRIEMIDEAWKLKQTDEESSMQL